MNAIANRTTGTSNTNRIAAFTLAIVMATLVNGSMLWQFNAMATDGAMDASSHVAVLETVTVIGHRA